MVSGGHARSGPPRDPNALHRRGTLADNGWIRLAAPTDPAPAWPLGDEPTDREISVWDDLWSRPQASVWPRFYLTREVAVYARTLAAFETPGKTNANLGGLVRKLADDLGLTIVGAARNQWLMPEPTAPATPATVTTLRSVPASGADTPALDLLARLRRDFGTVFPPSTVQYADAAAEVAALGSDLDPYAFLDK